MCNFSTKVNELKMLINNRKMPPYNSTKNRQTGLNDQINQHTLK